MSQAPPAGEATNGSDGGGAPVWGQALPACTLALSLQAALGVQLAAWKGGGP
jgi:hypothetical protein